MKPSIIIWHANFSVVFFVVYHPSNVILCCIVYLAVEPDEIYENEDETPKVGEDNEVDGDNDDVYDDVEAPTVAVPATLLSEPDRSESVSSASSSTSTAKRISIFGGSGKSKDGMPSEGVLSGYVQKKGKFSWDKKWFVLSDQTLYYANGDTDKKCQGMLSLVGASIDTKSSDSRPYAINIKYKNSKMQLAWDDSQVYDDWVKAIKVHKNCGVFITMLVVCLLSYQ